MKKPEKKLLTLPLRIALIILIIGALFKVMHWPYFKELMFIGFTSVSSLYLIRFLYKKSKKILDFVKLSIILLWAFSYMSKVFHFYTIPLLFELFLGVLVIWWLVEEGFHYFRKRRFKRKGILKFGYHALFGLGAFTLVSGLLFKIQHWPYGSELFTIGTITLCLLLILDYFLVERPLK